MISFLVDQNFNEHIGDGSTRGDATLEVTHVRDVGLAAAPDPTILEWAATRGLVLLTHDRKIIPPFAYDPLFSANLRCPCARQAWGRRIGCNDYT